MDLAGEEREICVSSDAAEDAEKKAAINERQRLRWRMIRTLATIASWVVLGLFSEVSGPTLPYLKRRVNSNYEEVSRTLVARSVGFLVGSLSGGALCQYWYKLTDLWLALALFIAAIGTALAPWCRNLALLGFMFALDGTGKGVLAAGGNFVILKLWGNKASVPNHALHFGFGIGALTAPQLARPFIPSADTSQLCGEDTSNMTANASNMTANASSVCDLGSDRIEYPYFIIGVATFLMGVLFMGLQLYGSHTQKDSENPMNESNQVKETLLSGKSRRQKILTILLFTLFFVFWALPIGAERAYGKFLFAFSLESQLAFSPGNGTTLVLVFWAAFTAGRGLATIFSRCLGSWQLLIIELIFNTSSMLVLSIWGHSQPAVLWTFSAVFGASLSPIFPGALAWANDHVTMTPMMTSLAFIAASFGAMAFSWISGYLFEYHGPRSLMFMLLVYAITATVLFVTIGIMFKLRSRDLKRTRRDAVMNGQLEENHHLKIKDSDL